MYKKRILGLAIASTLTLSGCLDNQKVVDTSNANAITGEDLTNQYLAEAEEAGSVWPVFDPGSGALPIPNDLIFDSDAGDGTFDVYDSTPPVTTALNSLSGASTSAAIDIQMSGLIDDTSVNAGNVFLIELAYMSGSPVQGLTIGEPPVPVGLADYDIEVIDMNSTSVIRLLPTEPLKPNTRYLVAIRNNILDLEGNPIIQSPGVSGYNLLTDPDQELASPALSSVRSLINGLWEPITQAVTTLGEDNLAMTYSFTTSGDEKVLEYIANPTEWFTDQLNTFVRITAAKSVLGTDGGTPLGDITADGATPGSDGQVNYLDIKLAADSAVAGFPDATTAAALPTLFGSGAPCELATGAAAISCAATALSASFTALLPTPSTQTVTIDDANAMLAAAKSALLASFDPTNAVKVVEGSIDLPYYLGVPTDTDGTAINSASWAADDTLATAMNAAFASVGLELPQADDEVSTNVNYVYPFPKKSEDVTVPLLATYNAATVIDGNDADTDGVDDNPVPVVIYQHGLRVDRSAMLGFATALSANGGYAVIGIDQPIHGIIPASAAETAGLAQLLLTRLNAATGGLIADDATNLAALQAGMLTNPVVQAQATVNEATADVLISTVIAGGTTGDSDLDDLIIGLEGAENAVAAAGSTIAGIDTTSQTDTEERHFGFTATAALTPTTIGSGSDVGGSGSLFINLLGFTNTRDKLRQGAVDLMNLTKSLGTIDLDGDGDADLDTSRVYFVAQSLGTVNGIPFVSSWNAAGQTPAINGASFQVPGGGLAKFLENSTFLSPEIILGLAANGVDQGTVNFEKFLNVFQAALDTTDPINFADNLNDACAFDNTVSVAGLNTFQTCTADTDILIAEISGSATRLPDLTIPNETLNNPLDDDFPSSISALSGTDPLVEELGLTNTEDGAASQVVSRFNQGSHGSFVLPLVTSSEPITEQGLPPGQSAPAATDTDLNAERLEVFTANLTETITLFAAGVTGAADSDILNSEAEHDALRAP